MVAAIGRPTRGEYTAETGEVRGDWTLICDCIVTGRGAHPGAPRKDAAPRPARREFDEDIPPP